MYINRLGLYIVIIDWHGTNLVNPRKIIDFIKDCRALSSDAYQTQNIEYFYDQVIEFLA